MNFDFLFAQGPQLLEKVLQHLLLTGISTLLAIVIGIPLGLFIFRRHKLRHIVMASVSILQTIPSLALLAFLLPLFGIGVTPALIALTLYALLPIVRNTLTGLETTPDDILEACAALGYTPKQQLLQVEVPLAMPVIIAGIRTATVICVGIATLAAFIGAGGLGDFIVRGLATNSTPLILLGAIPAALMALLLDFSIQYLERYFDIRTRQKRLQKTNKFKRYRLVLAASFTIMLTVFLAVQNTDDQAENTVIVASKNFTEQIILGEIIAQLLEANTDLNIIRKLNLGSVTFCHDAMLNGDIDIYPEYTGTAFRVILDRQENLSAAATYAAVEKNYREDFQLQWLEPFGFNNTYAITVRNQFADRYQLTNISDLNHISAPVSIGFAAAFYERSDGYPGFVKRYGLSFDDTAEMDLGLLFQALADERIDVAVGNSTDGRIEALDLRILDDDRAYFPPYFVAPIVRQEILDEHPEIKAQLKRLKGAINAQRMQQLNYAVEHNNQSITDVAQAFLLASQLLVKP